MLHLKDSPFQQFTSFPIYNLTSHGEARESPLRTERAHENTLQENLLKEEYPIHSCDKDERRTGNIIKLIHFLEKANKEKKRVLLDSSVCNSPWPGLGAPTRTPDFKAFWKIYSQISQAYDNFKDFKLLLKKNELWHRTLKYSCFVLFSTGHSWDRQETEGKTGAGTVHFPTQQVLSATESKCRRNPARH